MRKNLVFPGRAWFRLSLLRVPRENRCSRKRPRHHTWHTTTVKHCRRGRGHAAACRSFSQAVFTFAPSGLFCPGLHEPVPMSSNSAIRRDGSMMPVRRLLSWVWKPPAFQTKQDVTTPGQSLDEAKPAVPAAWRACDLAGLQREPNVLTFSPGRGAGWRGVCARGESRSWPPPPVAEPLRCASNRSTAARGIVTLGRTKEMRVAQLRRLQMQMQILRSYHPSPLPVLHRTDLISFALSLPGNRLARSRTRLPGATLDGAIHCEKPAFPACTNTALQHCSEGLQLCSSGEDPMDKIRELGGFAEGSFRLARSAPWKTFEEGAGSQSTGDLGWCRTRAQFLHAGA